MLKVFNDVTKTTVCSVISDSFVTLWTLANQAPLSMGLSRQEYWIGLPFPSPEDLHDPGIKSVSPASSVWAGGFFSTEPHGDLLNDVRRLNFVNNLFLCMLRYYYSYFIFVE